MSFRAYVVCEDHTLDQYVAVPVVQALLAHLDRPNAQVRAVTSPRLRGIDDLRANLCDLISRYSAIGDLVVICVDGDGKDGLAGRKSRRDQLLAAMNECDRGPEKSVLVVAAQELEVWALWGARGKLKPSWDEVRAEIHPKEVYFDKVVTAADHNLPGRGRSRLIAESLSSGWGSLTQGCIELAELEAEVRQLLDAG